MTEPFAKLEGQIDRLLSDLERLRTENVTLRTENGKLAGDLKERLDRVDAMEATSARYLKIRTEHSRFKQERAEIRREARGLLRRVRAMKKGGVAG